MWKRCGADVVLLGGTDLFLAFDGRDCGFPYINCADMHLAKVVESAIRNDTKI
jgi:aspartate racemase